MSSRGPRKGEAHVRLYRHELESEAYRSLSPEARALLVEFRALYNGRRNAIHMSVREAERRLGVGRWKAQRALSDLLGRGFIRVLEPGGFQRKTHHATVYALTNEPIEDRDGAVAPKDFMQWPQKSTVLVTSTVGVNDQHRSPEIEPQNGVYGVSDQHRKGEIDRSTVLVTNTQIDYQGGMGRWLMMCTRETQLKLVLALVALMPEQRAAA